MQKYKVFFNEKSILFSPDSNITLTKPWVKSLAFASNKEVLEWFFEFIGSDNEESVVEHFNPESQLRLFQSAFKRVDAAGGVVCRDEKILFIFRNGKWDLPKGKIDKGETPPVAAVREVEEECGITNVGIVEKLPSTFHIYQSPYPDTKGKWFFKETFWFEMQYSGNENGVPQLEEGITKVRWFAKNELDEVMANTYENLKQIIELYLD